MRSIGLSVLFFLLVGCAGSGVKSPSIVLSQINQFQNTNKVFVLRDTGYSGGGALMKVLVNGEEAGILGAGESLFSDTVTGENTVEVSFTGIGSLGISNPTYSSFSVSSTENRFFIVSLKTGAMTSKLRLMEVTEQSFRDAL